MTRDAKRFVGETTFSALASEPVHTSLWDDGDPIPHTRLGQAADLVVIAPATARFLAEYAAGLSDDLLTATLLATPRAGDRVSGDAHRDVGARRRCRRTSRRCGAAACTSSIPSRGGSRAETSVPVGSRAPS